MTKALVLSGGGSVGIAWQSGYTVGLAGAGVRLADADFVLGTSAGSAVGAQIALGRDLGEQLKRYAAAPRPASSGGERGFAPQLTERMQQLMQVMARQATSDDPPEKTRAMIGAFALEAQTGPEDGFVNAFSYLAGETWPAAYRCTAVDALDGSFRVWDAESGAPLERAVASSCAVPGLFPPITIGGRRYIDGGMRSGTNADLATGHERVLIVSMMTMARAEAAGAADPRAAQFRKRMSDETGVLTGGGARVEIVGPDDESAAALGLNLMDASKSAEASEAGVAQGKRDAGRIGAFWA